MGFALVSLENSPKNRAPSRKTALIPVTLKNATSTARVWCFPLSLVHLPLFFPGPGVFRSLHLAEGPVVQQHSLQGACEPLPVPTASAPQKNGGCSNLASMTKAPKSGVPSKRPPTFRWLAAFKESDVPNQSYALARQVSGSVLPDQSTSHSPKGVPALSEEPRIFASTCADARGGPSSQQVKPKFAQLLLFLFVFLSKLQCGNPKQKPWHKDFHRKAPETEHGHCSSVTMSWKLACLPRDKRSLFVGSKPRTIPYLYFFTKMGLSFLGDPPPHQQKINGGCSVGNDQNGKPQGKTLPHES